MTEDRGNQEGQPDSDVFGKIKRIDVFLKKTSLILRDRNNINL